MTWIGSNGVWEEKDQIPRPFNWPKNDCPIFGNM